MYYYVKIKVVNSAAVAAGDQEIKTRTGEKNSQFSSRASLKVRNNEES